MRTAITIIALLLFFPMYWVDKRVESTVVDTDTGDRGVVISVTPKVLKVKNQYSTATYTDIKYLMTFKDEIKVIGNISYTLRYITP
jgi:hypothetical protein